MGYYLPTDLIKVTLRILRQFKRPLSIEEIAFRMRIPRFHVRNILEILVRDNRVLQKDEGFILVRNKKNRISFKTFLRNIFGRT